MAEPHIIRLRGGWKLFTGTSSQPWSLPCPAMNFSSFPDIISLNRRFQHPPVRSAEQVTRLVAQSIAGITRVTVDGAEIPPEALIRGVVLDDTFATHELIVTLAAGLMLEDAEWGQFALIIEENAD